MSSSRKPPRDPGAPKRNMSAYLLYQNAMRDTFKQQVRRKKLSTSSPMGGGGAGPPGPPRPANGQFPILVFFQIL